LTPANHSTNQSADDERDNNRQANYRDVGCIHFLSFQSMDA
jgi:hypothetical protein